jgi:Zn-finger domain associated with topoisomerase type I
MFALITLIVMALKWKRVRFKIRGYDGPTLSCHKCGSEMQLKTGRFGKYFWLYE